MAAIPLALAMILFLFGIRTVRNMGVRWRYAVPFGAIPGLFPLFLGIFGFILGAMVLGAYFKIELPA